MTAKSKVTKIKPFKLSDLKPQNFRLQLEVPNNPDVDMWVELVGTESKEYAMAAAKLYQERGANTDDDVDLERGFVESASLAASIIKNWGPAEVFEMEYTPENAVALMSDYDYKWIKQQIEAAASERNNFFTK